MEPPNTAFYTPASLLTPARALREGATRTQSVGRLSPDNQNELGDHEDWPF